LGHAQTAQRKIEDGQSNYTSEAQERINRTYPMRQDTSEAIEVATGIALLHFTSSQFPSISTTLTKTWKKTEF